MRIIPRQEIPLKYRNKGVTIPFEPYTFTFTTAPSDATTNAPEITFSDLPSNHWASQAVSVMVQKGILNGYSDGKFRPNDAVKREEFAKIIVLALNLPISKPTTPTFKDINQNYWAYNYVESAKIYLTGYQKADGLYYKGSKNAVR